MFLTFSSYLSQVVALIVKHLDTVRPVVANEDLLPVVDNHAVGKLQVFGATEFVQQVALLVKNNHSHNLHSFGSKVIWYNWPNIVIY